MKTTIIMPIWVTKPELFTLTQNAYLSLAQTEGLAGTEFVLVDNGSTIGVDQFTKWADIYIRYQGNRGYPDAVNRGLINGTGDMFCVTNNDIRVSPNWLEVTKEIFKDKEIGSAHFKMIPYDEEIKLGDKIWKTGKERWCTSSFFVIKREALPKNLYDLDYGMGGYDDWDFWHRVRHVNKWKTAYTNKAVYQHKDSSTQNLNRDIRERNESDKGNRDRFKIKFGDYPEDIWTRLYPEQMAANYWEGFE